MDTFRKLLVLLALVSVMFGCEDEDNPFAVKKKDKPEFKISKVEPQAGEEVVLNADVSQGDVEEVTWIIEGKEYTGATISVKFSKGGEITVLLKIKYVDDDETYESSKTVTVKQAAVIVHKADIKADETWSSSQVHIVDGRLAIINATLTIEPGTVVKFKEHSALKFGDSEMQNSKLVAKGTAEKHITFTSVKENHQPGDWDRIVFGEFADKTSIMEYCDVSYAGGYAEYSGSIVIENKSIIFNHNTVTQSSSAGIACNDNAFFESFEDNEVKECKGSAIKINANHVNTLGTKKATPSRIDGNSLHGIYVYGNLDTKGNSVWQNLGSRYTISDRLYVGSTHGTTLTIEKGCTLSFMEHSAIKVGDQDNKTGNLIAKGTESEKINFVTEKVGNSGGNWDYLYFGEYTAEGSVLDHCIIDGGGAYAGYSATLRLDKAVISCTNTEIKNSVTDGIKCSNEGHFAKFANNTISSSAKSSIVIHANWVHLIEANNSIADDGFGIAVTGSNFDHKGGEFTWLKQSCPYTIMEDLDIGSKKTCSLVIEAGTTVRFAQGAGITVGADDNEMGKLIAKGTEKDKITFKPMVASGSWDYLFFGKGTMSGSILENCEIIRGGAYAGYSAAVVCDAVFSETPIIRNCLVKDSQSNGLIRNGNALVENVTYENIEGDDEKVEN